MATGEFNGERQVPTGIPSFRVRYLNILLSGIEFYQCSRKPLQANIFCHYVVNITGQYDNYTDSYHSWIEPLSIEHCGLNLVFSRTVPSYFSKRLAFHGNPHRFTSLRYSEACNEAFF